MTFNVPFKQVAAVSAMAALAACASTPEETDIAEQTVPVVTETVTPQPQPVEPVSTIIPGSQEDLEQNVGNLVYFGYDQYNLTPEAQATLSRQAAFLQEYPELRVRVAGNCDERGTREYNLALGARRANAARAYLVSLGVDPSRITTVSFGKERPIALGSNPQAWAQNRNAMTTIMSVGS